MVEFVPHHIMSNAAPGLSLAEGPWMDASVSVCVCVCVCHELTSWGLGFWGGHSGVLSGLSGSPRFDRSWIQRREGTPYLMEFHVHQHDPWKGCLGPGVHSAPIWLVTVARYAVQRL